eukprot:Pompholyxophrys_punicea_v1_NODE_146_length_3199_cov_26.441373.p2 type:complete len:133 gc:universal NODE_146_length_3199_cov_26.441373:2411-2809(+)
MSDNFHPSPDQVEEWVKAAIHKEFPKIPRNEYSSLIRKNSESMLLSNFSYLKFIFFLELTQACLVKVRSFRSSKTNTIRRECTRLKITHFENNENYEALLQKVWRQRRAVTFLAWTRFVVRSSLFFFFGLIN